MILNYTGVPVLRQQVSTFHGIYRKNVKKTKEPHEWTQLSQQMIDLFGSWARRIKEKKPNYSHGVT